MAVRSQYPLPFQVAVICIDVGLLSKREYRHVLAGGGDGERKTMDNLYRSRPDNQCEREHRIVLAEHDFPASVVESTDRVIDDPTERLGSLLLP